MHVHRLAVLFRDGNHSSICSRRDTLQRTATRCNALQNTATHCNTPQHAIVMHEEEPLQMHVHRLAVLCRDSNGSSMCSRRDTLQCTATHLNTPQHMSSPYNTESAVALARILGLTRCHTLQHITPHRNTLATHRDAPQRAATRRLAVQRRKRKGSRTYSRRATKNASGRPAPSAVCTSRNSRHSCVAGESP